LRLFKILNSLNLTALRQVNLAPLRAKFKIPLAAATLRCFAADMYLGFAAPNEASRQI